MVKDLGIYTIYIYLHIYKESMVFYIFKLFGIYNNQW